MCRRDRDSRVGGRNAARNMHAQNNITNQGGRQVRIQHILDGVIYVVLQGGDAVSYTHLDVYKRQFLTTALSTSSGAITSSPFLKST